jgi:hypothetical protein
MKKALIVVCILVITVLLLFVFLKKPNKSFNPVSAIPKTSAIIIKANGFTKFITSINDNNFYQNAINDSVKKAFYSLKFSLDSFINENTSIKKVLSDSSIYISYHLNKNTSNGINFYLPFGTLTDFDVVAAKVYFYLKKKGIELYKYNPLETKTENPNTVYYFNDKGILVLGSKLINVQETYIQIRTQNNLYSDTSFLKVFNTSGKNANSCIYLNMSKVNGILKNFFKTGYQKFVASALNVKGWTALDLNIDLKNISLHGFSDFLPQNQVWVKLLKNELPASNSIISVLPKSTAYFGLISANDFYNYKIAFREKQKKDPGLANEVGKLKNNFGENIDNKLFDIISGNIITCLTCNNGCSKYCIITTRNNIDPLTFINSFNKTKKLKGKQIKSDDSTVLKTITVKLPGKNLPSFFGDFFGNSDYSYATNYKECIILGESEQSLNNYLNEINNDKTILQDSSFRQVLSGAIASKSNLTFYFNLAKIKTLVPEFISENILKYLNSSVFDKTSKSIAGIQVSGNGNYFYNNIFLYSEPTLAQGPELVWTAKLDTNPELIPTPLTLRKSQYYFVQDKKFNAYLLSSSGDILWKKAVNNKILSKIHKLDFLGNGNEQIVFNTSENLYVLNSHGEDIIGFPITFKTVATNGLAIADFDKNKNYRFYLAFENNRFVALDIKGKPVEGWKFDVSKGIVTKPAQCFTFKQKDYIVFSDSSNIYVLNRKGENRTKIKEKISISPNNETYIELRNAFYKLISADNQNNVNGVYPDGHIDVTNFNLSASNKYFIYSDLNNDKIPDYIFADSTSINAFNAEKKNIYSISSTEKIEQKPIIISDKDGKTFIAYLAGGKVYLTDAGGKLLKGFPINGNFPMNVISLYDVSYSFAIITSNENKLNCYFVH